MERQIVSRYSGLAIVAAAKLFCFPGVYAHCMITVV